MLCMYMSCVRVCSEVYAVNVFCFTSNTSYAHAFVYTYMHPTTKSYFGLSDRMHICKIKSERASYTPQLCNSLKSLSRFEGP